MRRSHLVAALAELVAIPSVSSDPNRVADVQRCARLLATRLGEIGLARVQLMGDARRPLVYGEWLRAPGRQTVLIYGHYDVVAAEPAAFRPNVRGAYLYGRGASDDKGPLLCHLIAIGERLRRDGALPVNVRVLLDGEEEIGSPALGRLVHEQPESLRADIALVSDTRMLGPGRPTLVYGLRGKLDARIVVRGRDRDLHSGQFGGVVANPANVLCSLVGSLVGADGTIALPGFYDGVRSDDLADAAARPALDVTGLLGGHTGPGVKGIIPARASAQLSFRLAPGQRPQRVRALLRKHCARPAPTGVSVKLTTAGGRPPLALDPKSPAQRAAARAAAAAFGRAPALIRSGGSIMAPVLFRELLGLESVLLGFALPDDGIHGPVERVHLPTLERGIVASGCFLDELAVLSRVAVAA
jgi:acetylornithine deacetylase/succinyl-diaminopimelate desuccinylase-like protein